jgi:hypothetical protein
MCETTVSTRLGDRCLFVSCSPVSASHSDTPCAELVYDEEEDGPPAQHESPTEDVEYDNTQELNHFLALTNAQRHALQEDLTEACKPFQFGSEEAAAKFKTNTAAAESLGVYCVWPCVSVCIA